MSIISRILSIGLSSILILTIFELIRRRKLKEKYAGLWLLIGCVIFIFAAFDKLALWLSKLFGIQLPINLMFFFGIFFIILMNLHFSLVISILVEQNKKIIQKLALLEMELKKDRK